MRLPTFYFIIIFLTVFSSNGMAQTKKSLDDRRLSDEYVMQQLNDSTPKIPESAQSSPQLESNQSVSLNEEELHQHPDLIIRATLAALLQNNSENIAILLPYYQKLPVHLHEPAIETWGKAIIARSRGQYNQAIRLYREVLAQHNDWFAARLQTASTLLNNKEWEAAEEQFRKLQSEENIPTELIQEIESVLSHIRQQSHWQFQGGITLINDKNINNVPKNPDLGDGLKTDKLESGQGFALNLGTNKKWFWKKGWFHELRLDASHKYYWNNKRFNEASLRTSIGIGYQNAKTSVALLPFFEQMWYAGGKKGQNSLHQFSKSKGLGLEFSHLFTPQWQGNIYAETMKNNYQTRPHLNGSQHFVSLTALYRYNARQTWFGGIDYSRNQTRDKEDSFFRQGIRIGWIQEWKGLSTRISTSYGWKKYRSIGFFNKIQSNHELGLQTSLWHRAIHWQGLTPRLTWSYTKTNSNIPLYQYHKHRIFIEVNKQF